MVEFKTLERKDTTSLKICMALVGIDWISSKIMTESAMEANFRSFPLFADITDSKNCTIVVKTMGLSHLAEDNFLISEDSSSSGSIMFE